LYLGTQGIDAVVSGRTAVHLVCGIQRQRLERGSVAKKRARQNGRTGRRQRDNGARQRPFEGRARADSETLHRRSGAAVVSDVNDRLRIMVSRHSAFYSPLISTIASGFLEREGLQAEYSILGPGQRSQVLIRDR